MFSACCKTHCISWPRNCPCPLPINPTDHLPTVAGRGDVAIKCPPSTVSTCYQKRHGHDESCSGELSGNPCGKCLIQPVVGSVSFFPVRKLPVVLITEEVLLQLDRSNPKQSSRSTASRINRTQRD
uniref:Uncharacterized protein n=1 Tax=Anopheles dirus TaxID=7168 RepID=A0A182NWZ4_9DIPT